MKRNCFRTLAAIIAAALVAASCGNGTEKRKTMADIDNSLTESEIGAGILTPEVMWKLDRVGSSGISPDGKYAVYTVTRYSMEENKGYSSIFLAACDKSFTRPLTDGRYVDGSPEWNRDGSAVYFLSDRSGDSQVWKMEIDPDALAGGGRVTEPVQVSTVGGGVEGFLVSPDESHVLFARRVMVDSRNSQDIYPDLPLSRAKIYDDLMARHWNRWEDGSRLHLFVAPTAGAPFASGRNIMEYEPWDAPMAPYFDMDEIAWNNSGNKIAYTCKKLTGKEYALSTDSDIYLYDMETDSTRNLTKGMPGYDRYPRFSPDDSRLAFVSMLRPGNESDKDRLMVMNLSDGAVSYLTEGFDHSASNATWDGDDRLFFISGMNGTYGLCYATPSDPGNITVALQGDFDLNRFTLGQGMMVGEITSISSPSELYAIDPYKGEMSRLTDANAAILPHIRMGKVERHYVPTTDGKQMLTWIILPPDFDPAKKYPTLLYCQGGPQSTVSQFWSYRWNFQLMAAQGYVVVAPNRRGTPSFGQEWLDQISGDYSGQNIRDLLSAIDYASGKDYVDKDRLGCVGASYGGYSCFFLAGNHQKRFKAFVAHCGMFNFESKYGSTEELWFPNNDLGGPYWSDDPVAKRSFANSPHRFVKNWDTPILIITGANDFRIPYTESLQAFTAARLMGVPSRLVFFENEAHQVFKAQNSLTWNREFFGWLDKYVKGEDR